VRPGPPDARVLAGLGAVSAAFYAVTVRQASIPVGAMTLYLTVLPFLFGLYLAGVWLAVRRPAPGPPPRGAPRPAALATILAFGLLFRVLLLPTPIYLSSDLYRYFWDGRVQLAGINPYRHAPAAPELAHLRDDDLHPSINRPTSRTIYPPAAQWLFAAAAATGIRSVLAWRLLILAAEGVTVALLLALLRRHRLAETAVLVYAWSPLVVFEGVQAGHLDLLMVPLVLLALLWRGGGAPVRAGLALGLAVLLKLYPAVLALAWSARPGGAGPAGDPGGRARWPGAGGWWRARDWPFIGAVAGTVALGYAPYLWALGAGAFGFLPEYFGPAEDHNIGLRGLLTYGFGWTGAPARYGVMALLFAVLLGALVWIARGGSTGLARTGAAAVGAYLALVPTAMHPWYVVWIVPFLCLAPSLAWLYFSGAVSLSYVAFIVAPDPLPAWAWLAQYAPLFGLLAVEAWRARAGRPALAAAPRTT
jgi:alpha-1,6-mannosyltransferase